MRGSILFFLSFFAARGLDVERLRRVEVEVVDGRRVDRKDCRRGDMIALREVWEGAIVCVVMLRRREWRGGRVRGGVEA